MPDAVDDVELGLLERRRDLVLDDLDPGAVADGVGAVLERLDAADVQAHRRVELQRLATGRGLGLPNITPIFSRSWLMKIAVVLGVAERAGDLAQRLGHQAGLQADVAVAHLALDLGPRHQRGDRVDDDEVDRAGADQHVGDLQRLLAGVGLRDQQRVDVDAELLGVLRVERVLGVDERRDAAGLLRVGDRVQRDAWSCRRTPGRRSRRRGRAADRRCRARRRGRSSRWGSPRSGARVSSPSRMTEPLPNCRSICASAASRAFSRSAAAMGATPSGRSDGRRDSGDAARVIRSGTEPRPSRPTGRPGTRRAVDGPVDDGAPEHLCDTQTPRSNAVFESTTDTPRVSGGAAGARSRSRARPRATRPWCPRPAASASSTVRPRARPARVVGRPGRARTPARTARPSAARTRSAAPSRLPDATGGGVTAAVVGGAGQDGGTDGHRPAPRRVLPRHPRLVRGGVRRAHRRAGRRLGRRRRPGATPWWSPRPARARRSPRSCGRSTGSPREPRPDDPLRRCRVLYVSPLKALAVDVERNLRARWPASARPPTRLGLPEPDVTVGMRSGDTPADERRRARHAAARRPDHHARVAVPAAHLAGARGAARASRR